MDTYDKNYFDSLVDYIFDGRYIIVEYVAQGGMSVIFRIESNDQFRLPFALKIIEKGQAATYQEIEALKTVGHAGIPKIFEVKEDNRNIYIVQEFINGESLEEIIKRDGAVNERQALEWAKELVRIFAYMHRLGIIHRDIKPANIMLDRSGQLKVVDFGISKTENTSDLIDMRLIGTEGYTAPERYLQEPAGKQSDIYSFGCTLYFLLVGAKPLPVMDFDSEKTDLILRDLKLGPDSILKAVIDKSVQPNPRFRFQSFEEIDEFISNSERQKESQQNPKKEKRKFSVFYLLAALLGIGLLAFSGFFLYSNSQNRKFQENLELAMDYNDSNEYSKAQSVLNELIEEDPNRPEPYEELFESYYNEGNYQDVVDLSKQALKNNPSLAENSRVNYLIGSSLYNLRNYSDAQNYLQKALDADKSVDTLTAIGLNYAAQGKADQTNETISELEALSERDVSPEYLTGILQYQQGNVEQGLSTLNQAAQSASSDDLKRQIVYSISQIYQGLGNYPEQIKLLENYKRVGLFPNDFAVNEQLGNAYFKKAQDSKEKADYESAVNIYEDLLRRGRKSKDIYSNLANAYLAQKNYTLAESVINDMQLEYPQDAMGYILKATLILQTEGEKPEKDRNLTEFQVQMQKAKENNDGTYDSMINDLQINFNALAGIG